MNKIKSLIKKISKLVPLLFQKIFNTYFIKCHYFKTKIDIKKSYSLEINPIKLKYEDFLNSSLTELSEEKLNLIKKRFNSGNYVAYGEFIDGKLAYSTWISFKNFSIQIVDKIVQLNDDEAVLEDSYCHPYYRGRGLHSMYNMFRLQLIHSASKSFVIVLVFSNNLAALKTQENSGLVNVGSFKIGKILGFPFTTFNKDMLDKKFNSIIANK